MKIIIVGNSDNNLNYNFGKEIDNFDVVVRFNNFQLKGFESYVGTKINFLWLSRPFLDRAKDFDKITFLTYENYISSAPHKCRHHFKAVSPYHIPPPPGNVYSSGINVINYFLKDSENEVFIHGICDGGKSHYWNKKFKVYPKHNLINETKLLTTFNIKHLRDHVS
jgi:hypothetical protein